MRTITNQMLIDGCKAALKAGILAAAATAKNPELRLKSRYSQCSDGKHYCCAVGAVMTPTEVFAVEGTPTGNDVGSCSAVVLVNKGVLQFEDLVFAKELQNDHDNWLSSAHKQDNIHKHAFYQKLGLITPEELSIIRDVKALLDRDGALDAIRRHTGQDVASISRLIDNAVSLYANQ